MNSTLYISKYGYRYNLLNDRRDFNWKAGLTEVGFKNEIDYFLGQGDIVKMGLNLSRTGYKPGEYKLDSSRILSFAFTRTMQYVHLLSNSSVGLPTDIWLPANNNVGPQSADLLSVGLKQKTGLFEVGIETYYKAMKGVIDFIDNADLFVNQYVDSQIKSGNGRAT